MGAPRRTRKAIADLLPKRPPVPTPAPELQTVPIARRHLVGSRDPRTSLGVFCPSQEATVSVDRCAECGFLEALPADRATPRATLRCAPPDMKARRDARRSPRIDVAEAAARVPLGELVRRELVCVTADTRLEKLLSLIAEHGLDAVPVVDQEWRLVGIVSRTDLALNDGSDGAVGDVMSPCAHWLPEDARLSHAVSLMATQSIHHVPILTHEGAVVGMVTSLDCMRWMAREMGYSAG